MVSATPRGPPGVRSRGLSIFNLNLDCRGGGESEKFSSRSTTRKEKSRPSDQPLGKPGRRTPKMPGQRLFLSTKRHPETCQELLNECVGNDKVRMAKIFLLAKRSSASRARPLLSLAKPGIEKRRERNLPLGSKEERRGGRGS